MLKAGWLLIALALAAPLLAPGTAGAEGPGTQLGLAGSYDTAGWARGVAVAGGYAYVADDEGGLVVVDVSDPTGPVRVGGYDTSSYAQGMVAASDYAYVAAGSGGLVVVDVSDPTDPTYAGGYDTGDARGVALASGYAYVADGVNGLVVVDVSDPTDPTRAGGYGTGDARDVAVAGGYAYVADYENGLVVVDVSDPTDPTRAGGYDTAGSAQGVAVAGGYAYVVDGDGGLVVVDVSDPADPTRVGGYDTAGYALGVAVVGGYAYVADGREGLVVVDVSNPADPIRVGGYDAGGSAWGVAISGGYAYVVDDYEGLVVLGPDGDGDGIADISDAFPDTAWLHAWWQAIVIVLLIATVIGIPTAFTLWSRRAIGSAERALRGFARDGVLLGPARERLARARRARRRFNYPAAVALARSARQRGETLAGEHRQLALLIARLRAEVAALRDEGVVTVSLEGKLAVLEDALGGDTRGVVSEAVGMWLEKTLVTRARAGSPPEAPDGDPDATLGEGP